jgi:hypothetical protein
MLSISIIYRRDLPASQSRIVSYECTLEPSKLVRWQIRNQKLKSFYFIGNTNEQSLFRIKKIKR